MIPGAGNILNIDFTIVDLPLPDSPTKPKISFFSMLKDTLSTALKCPSSVKKSTHKFCICNKLFNISFSYNRSRTIPIEFFWICSFD